ncbi:MAG: patatin family protein, partial [Muribaculaceae bacterium]
LEGGALRGLFSAGVIDVMMENGIDFEGVIGVSAGSNFGCNYKSRQPGRVIRYNVRFANDSRYMGWRSLLTTGNLVGAEFAYHYMPLKLDVFDIATFESDPMEFYLVCTDCLTGEPVYYRMDKVNYESLEWLRASASMPLVTRPVKVDGRVLLDGGISDSIPLKHFQSMGFDRNVVVLTRPRNYRKEPTKLWPYRLLMRRYPAITQAMARRHEMYNSQLDYVEREEKAGRIFVIAPDEELPIGRVEMNIEKMNAVYNIGRENATALLPRLREFLQG